MVLWFYTKKTGMFSSMDDYSKELRTLADCKTLFQIITSKNFTSKILNS
jgi:hypothetical protein